MFKHLMGEAKPASAKETIKELLLGILLVPLVIGGFAAIVLFLLGYFEPVDQQSCAGTRLVVVHCKAYKGMYSLFKWFFAPLGLIMIARYFFKDLK